MDSTHKTENEEIDMVTANLDMLHILYTKEKATRIEEGIAFYDRLAKQCKTQSEVFSLLHKYIEPEVCKMIFDAKFPGCCENNCSSLLEQLEKLDQCQKQKQISLMKRIWAWSVSLARPNTNTVLPCAIA